MTPIDSRSLIQRAASLGAMCCATAGAACLPAHTARAAAMLGAGDVLELSFGRTDLFEDGALSVSKFIGLDKSYSTSIDLGVLEAKATARAAAGLQVDARLTGSTTSVAFGGTATAAMPTYIAAGQSFSLQTNWLPTFGTMTTTTPQAALDLKLLAEVSVRGEVSAFGRAKDFKVGGREVFWAESMSMPRPQPWTYSSDLLSAEARLPTLTSQGSTYANGIITEETSGGFFHGRADIDAAVTKLTGIEFGIDRCLSIAVARGCFELSLIDAGLTLDASLQREMALRPQVVATYTLEDGRNFSGAIDRSFEVALVEGFDYGASLDVGISYGAFADLQTITSIEADVGLELELLKGHARLEVLKPSCKWLKLKCKFKFSEVFDANFGPVWEHDWQIADASFKLSFTDQHFEGFGQTLASMQIPILPAGADPRAFGFELMAYGPSQTPSQLAYQVSEPPPVLGMLVGLMLLRRRWRTKPQSW